MYPGYKMPSLVKDMLWEEAQDQVEREGLFVIPKLVKEVLEVQEESLAR